MRTHSQHVYYHRKSNKTVTLRSVDLDTDFDCLFAWMNQPHVIPNWRLNISKTELYKHFQTMLEDTHQWLFIVAIDGNELCYAETYYAPDDRLANFCEVKSGDYGMHLLIGPPQEIGKGHSEAILCALTDYLFQRHQATRVLIEPNCQVKQLSILERKLGFSNLGYIKLPEKIAILYAIESADFYKIDCEMKEWPLVRMHFPNHPQDLSVDKWLQEIDKLLQREQPCVVISTFDEHYQFSTVARRRQALWFKKNKDLLELYCLGMVRVTQDQEMIEKITSNAMRQGMPFICTPASTVEEAEIIAKKLLHTHHQDKKWKQKIPDTTF